MPVRALARRGPASGMHTGDMVHLRASLRQCRRAGLRADRLPDMCARHRRSTGRGCRRAARRLRPVRGRQPWSLARRAADAAVAGRGVRTAFPAAGQANSFLANLRAISALPSGLKRSAIMSRACGQVHPRAGGTGTQISRSAPMPPPVISFVGAGQSRCGGSLQRASLASPLGGHTTSPWPGVAKLTNER